MSSDLVTRFLDQAGEMPFREVVGHNARRQTHGMLVKLLREETARLPTQLAARVERYVAAIEQRFLAEDTPWKTLNSRDAFTAVLDVARSQMGLEDRLPDSTSLELPENQELVFRLFQIATLHLAYTAATRKAARGRMAIKIGWFFR